MISNPPKNKGLIINNDTSEKYTNKMLWDFFKVADPLTAKVAIRSKVTKHRYYITRGSALQPRDDIWWCFSCNNLTNNKTHDNIGLPHYSTFSKSISLFFP